tara:strand:- start:40 stop:342 length:303 start_codon:yes stop_codon:yes gene_type:complete
LNPSSSAGGGESLIDSCGALEVEELRWIIALSNSTSNDTDDLLKGIGALVIMLLYYFAGIAFISSVIMLLIGKFSFEVAVTAIAAFLYLRWFQQAESKMK